MSKELSLMQKKFISNFIKCGSGTEAALKAGYSPHTAKCQAANMMMQPHIKKEISKRTGAVLARTELNVEKWINEIVDIIDDCTKKEDYNIKLKALDLAGKYLKLFTQQIDLKADVKVESIEAYLKRKKKDQ